jgi:hypothetical protein
VKRIVKYILREVFGEAVGVRNVIKAVDVSRAWYTNEFDLEYFALDLNIRTQPLYFSEGVYGCSDRSPYFRKENLSNVCAVDSRREDHRHNQVHPYSQLGTDPTGGADKAVR